MTKTPTKSKRKPTDSTLRNVRAANKKIAAHELRIRQLEMNVARLLDAVPSAAGRQTADTPNGDS